ncbi:MAG: VanW family protein, partial [Rubrobacteraceae bacterium]
GGKEEYAAGGGLCQVVSTLYMAANYAGLDVVERNPHSAMLPYIRPGFDATVWFGSLDMKFENTTDGYVLVREYVADDGYVYAEVWGRPTGREVEMSSERLSADSESATWVTYQEIKEDGEVVFDGVLHEDTYYALETTDGEVISPESFTPAPPDP